MWINLLLYPLAVALLLLGLGAAIYTPWLVALAVLALALR